MARRTVAVLLLALCLPAAAQARRVTPLPKSFQKGMNVAAFRWDDFSGRRARASLRRLRADHAGEVLFVTRWLQYWRDGLRGDDLNATDIQPGYGDAKTCKHWPRPDYRRCQTPSVAAEEALIRYAKGLGLKVGLKPLLDVGSNGRNQFDRTKINYRDPAQRDAWFASYRGMLAVYARIARDTGADTLVIGTGLTGMTDGEAERDLWRQMIDDIRSGALIGDGRGGFGGRLTYAARWDSIYKDVYDINVPLFFWGALDEIGVEGFWPLVNGTDSDHDNPAVSRLRTGWTLNFLPGGIPPGAALRALHDEYSKPVILTGLGYLSRGGTSAAPFKGNDEQKAAGGKVNYVAQLRPYRAAFDFWGRVARTQSWFRGIYFWNWLPHLPTPRNGDYSPQGKPAERELCVRWLGRDARSCRR